MFIKLEKNGSYVGASNRALDGYFPVSAELHKSIRRTVVANASRIRNNRNWKPEPLVVTPEAIWEDIQDYPQAVLETYASLYADSLEIEIAVIPFMADESKMLASSISKMRKYLMSKEMPSNLYDFVYEVSNLGDIPEAKFEPKKELAEEEVVPEPEEEKTKDAEKPRKPRKKPSKSKGNGDEKSDKPSGDKTGEGSNPGPVSDPDTKRDGGSEQKDN